MVMLERIAVLLILLGVAAYFLFALGALAMSAIGGLL